MDSVLLTTDTIIAPVDQPKAVISEFRKIRRARRTASIDRFEAFYRVYLTAVFIGVLIFLASGQVGDLTAGKEQVAIVRRQGAAAAGLIFAVACWGGMRSGTDGGPLVIEPADARFALGAPLDRTEVLRGPALRKLRFGSFVGMVAGGVAGIVAYRRFPGGLGNWTPSLALFAAVVTIGWNGCALLFSGTRWSRASAAFAGFFLTVLSSVDLLTGSRLAPGTLVGRIAVWALDLDLVGVLGVVGSLLVAGAGLNVVGGTSIEKAQRRSGLVSGLRFSAFLGDVRMVVLTRRQLAHEDARSRPILRLETAERSYFPVWKRGWQGILRWPGRRIGRVLILGAVAGLALALTWRDVTPLLLVAGGLLYLAGLDVIDPLGQETDHATFHESFPIQRDSLFLKHLPVSFIVMLSATSLTVGVAVLGGSGISLPVAMAIAATAAMSSVVGAAASTTASEPALIRSLQSASPEIMGMRYVSALAHPPLLATLGLVPFLVARESSDGALPAAALVSLALTVLVTAARFGRPLLAKAGRR